MTIIENEAWIYYIDVLDDYKEDKVGKWMYFFGGEGAREFAEGICKRAVEEGVVGESQHSNAEEGVCCFYLNSDDMERHNKVIKYFLDNDLIPKTDKGKLYNISFKLNNQTREGEYGDDFKAEIKLDQFLNLETGEWLE